MQRLHNLTWASSDFGTQGSPGTNPPPPRIPRDDSIRLNKINYWCYTSIGLHCPGELARWIPAKATEGSSNFWASSPQPNCRCPSGGPASPAASSLNNWNDLKQGASSWACWPRWRVLQSCFSWEHGAGIGPNRLALSPACDLLASSQACPATALSQGKFKSNHFPLQMAPWIGFWRLSPHGALHEACGVSSNRSQARCLQGWSSDRTDIVLILFGFHLHTPGSDLKLTNSATDLLAGDLGPRPPTPTTFSSSKSWVDSLELSRRRHITRMGEFMYTAVSRTTVQSQVLSFFSPMAWHKGWNTWPYFLFCKVRVQLLVIS